MWCAVMRYVTDLKKQSFLIYFNFRGSKVRSLCRRICMYAYVREMRGRFYALLPHQDDRFIIGERR